MQGSQYSVVLALHKALPSALQHTGTCARSSRGAGLNVRTCTQEDAKPSVCQVRQPHAAHRQRATALRQQAAALSQPEPWRNFPYTLRISSERARGGDRLRLCTIGPLLACAAPTAADSDSATGSRAAPL